ncbi:MAG: hypothetical protein J5854_02475 [Clostridia bacterium]|nr:hypothetical protein [Clostridia bacterium]
MIKNNIIYLNENGENVSLRCLPLQPDCENRIEYIFYTLNIARDFDDLTALLGRVLACPFEEVSRRENYILYEVIVDDERRSLKFTIKKNEMQQAA